MQLMKKHKSQNKTISDNPRKKITNFYDLNKLKELMNTKPAVRRVLERIFRSQEKV